MATITARFLSLGAKNKIKKIKDEKLKKTMKICRGGNLEKGPGPQAKEAPASAKYVCFENLNFNILAFENFQISELKKIEITKFLKFLNLKFQILLVFNLFFYLFFCFQTFHES